MESSPSKQVATLVGDIGGTNARFRLQLCSFASNGVGYSFNVQNRKVDVVKSGTLPTSDYKTLTATVKAFLESVEDKSNWPELIVLGVASERVTDARSCCRRSSGFVEY